jgi:HbrB-like
MASPTAPNQLVTQLIDQEQSTSPSRLGLSPSSSSSSTSSFIEHHERPPAILTTAPSRASTTLVRSPPSGGGSQSNRHTELPSPSTPSTPTRQPSFPANISQLSLDRSSSSVPPRPTSPVNSPSIHKSLNALDAKMITRDIERSIQRSTSSKDRDDLLNSPTSMIIPSFSSLINENSDVWQLLCIRVLPLFNGEGVNGAIEDLNELFRRSLTEPISPTLHRDIEALLRDGMFTLNAKLFGVTDEKLMDRLVEQWSFFFGNVLPYFEATFLPLRTDVRYASIDDMEYWNVRNMALQSFRDYVILPLIKRLEGNHIHFILGVFISSH